jgi:prevent-host-death family protein
MKRVSIQELKATLSAAVADAEAGATILVTRHGEPVAKLAPALRAHVHRGTDVGTVRLRPAIRKHTKGRYLQVLDDDRGNR